ncbi:MAG: TolB family protein, partial [Nitrososphaera sp.]
MNILFMISTDSASRVHAKHVRRLTARGDAGGPTARTRLASVVLAENLCVHTASRITRTFSLFLVAVLILSACAEKPVVPPRRATMPVWSPNGKLIAFVCYEDGPFISDPAMDYAQYTEGAAEICVIDLLNRRKVRLTHNKTEDTAPVWSLDGRSIAFIGYDGLYTIQPDGTDLRRLVESRWIESATWSPNGKRLAFSECNPIQTAQIFIVGSTGEGLKQLTDEVDLMSEGPLWSPDGLRLAYKSSKGNCSETRFSNETFRLRFSDTLKGTSKEILNRDLYELRDIAWLDSDKIAFTFSDTLATPRRFD